MLTVSLTDDGNNHNSTSLQLLFSLAGAQGQRPCHSSARHRKAFADFLYDRFFFSSHGHGSTPALTDLIGNARQNNFFQKSFQFLLNGL